MGNKITVIGVGSVGATIAYNLTNENIASQIVLIDINKTKVEVECMDIGQGTYFRDPVAITCGDYADAKDSDIVIITSGVGRKPGQSRIDLSQINIDIIKDIAPKIAAAAPNALYIIISNPVDIITYVFTKLSGIPEHRIIGSGTVLDTARLRCGLSENLSIAQKNIHAYVLGEHGDTSFIPWSIASVEGMSIDQYMEKAKMLDVQLTPINKEETLTYMQKSGGKIIAGKGATFYAIASCACNLSRLLLASSDSIATVSTLHKGEYGINDICLSSLTIIGPNGVKGRLEVPLTAEELAQLQKSADALKDVLSQVTI